MIYAKAVMIGVLHNHTIDILEEVHQNNNTPTIYLSQLDYEHISFEILPKLTKCFSDLKLIFIPRYEDHKFINQNAKNPKYTLFCDWMIRHSFYQEIVITTNGVKYIITNTPIKKDTITKDIKLLSNDLFWHKEYDGRMGYAISTYKKAINDKDLYFNYSVSLYANNDLRIVNEKGIRNN